MESQQSQLTEDEVVTLQLAARRLKFERKTSARNEDFENAIVLSNQINLLESALKEMKTRGFVTTRSQIEKYLQVEKKEKRHPLTIQRIQTDPTKRKRRSSSSKRAQEISSTHPGNNNHGVGGVGGAQSSYVLLNKTRSPPRTQKRKSQMVAPTFHHSRVSPQFPHQVQSPPSHRRRRSATPPPPAPNHKRLPSDFINSEEFEEILRKEAPGIIKKLLLEDEEIHSVIVERFREHLTLKSPVDNDQQHQHRHHAAAGGEYSGRKSRKGSLSAPSSTTHHDHHHKHNERFDDSPFLASESSQTAALHQHQHQHRSPPTTSPSHSRVKSAGVLKHTEFKVPNDNSARGGAKTEWEIDGRAAPHHVRGRSNATSLEVSPIVQRRKTPKKNQSPQQSAAVIDLDPFDSPPPLIMASYTLSSADKQRKNSGPPSNTSSTSTRSAKHPPASFEAPTSSTSKATSSKKVTLNSVHRSKSAGTTKFKNPPFAAVMEAHAPPRRKSSDWISPIPEKVKVAERLRKLSRQASAPHLHDVSTLLAPPNSPPPPDFTPPVPGSFLENAFPKSFVKKKISPASAPSKMKKRKSALTNSPKKETDSNRHQHPSRLLRKGSSHQNLNVKITKVTSSSSNLENEDKCTDLPAKSKSSSRSKVKRHSRRKRTAHRRSRDFDVIAANVKGEDLLIQILFKLPGLDQTLGLHFDDGLRVSKVEEGSMSHKRGVQEGWVITSVDGSRAKDKQKRLEKQIQESLKNGSVYLGFRQEGRTYQVLVDRISYRSAPNFESWTKESIRKGQTIKAMDIQQRWVQDENNELWLPLTVGKNKKLELTE